MCELCEEVVTLVIYDDERREVLHIDLTHSLHTQLWEVNNLYTLNRVLGQYGSRTSDRAEIETAICLTSIIKGIIILVWFLAIKRRTLDKMIDNIN